MVRIISLETEKEILRLLAEGGRSQHRIASMVGVSQQMVSKIANRGCLRPRSASECDGEDDTNELCVPMRCPTCREMVTTWPCTACNPEPSIRSSAFLPEEISGPALHREAPALCGVVSDVVSLYGLRLIQHPLFVHLAMRACNVMSRLHGVADETSKTKQ